jgi:hypothetical protein
MRHSFYLNISRKRLQHAEVAIFRVEVIGDAEGCLELETHHRNVGQQQPAQIDE